MTRKEALAELIAKVEAGTPYETMGHTMMCQRAFPKPDDFDGSRESYSNSAAQMAILAWRNDDLNAAKALHDAGLPGWDYILTNAGEHGGESPGPMAAVGERDALERGDEPFKASTNILARAWLLSILRALHSMEAT